MNQRRLRTRRASQKANHDCSCAESYATLLSKAVTINLFRRVRTLTGAGGNCSYVFIGENFMFRQLLTGVNND